MYGFCKHNCSLWIYIFPQKTQKIRPQTRRACWKVWESVTGRGHSAVNSGTAARTSDEPWTSEWRLCNWCTRGLAASVTTAAKAWHWFCCCSASRHGPSISWLRCILSSDVDGAPYNSELQWSRRDSTMLHPVVTASSVDSMCCTWRRARVWNVHAFVTALTRLSNRRWSSNVTPSDFSLCDNEVPATVSSYGGDGLQLSGSANHNSLWFMSDFYWFKESMTLNLAQRSSKVIDFGTNRNLVYKFLLVVNSNLDPILRRFSDTAA